MKNQLRIIGGEYKRRQLPFASIDGLRPTPDRVRETLFNWLMWEIQGIKVLDVCAGSGALGFEALSRGAKHVVMIEPNHEQVKFLQQNLKLLNISHAQVIAKTAQHVLKNLNETFNLVFLDPPYALDLWAELASLIDPLLADHAWIYIEADRDLNLLELPSDWHLIKETKAGTVRAGLFQKT